MIKNALINIPFPMTTNTTKPFYLRKTVQCFWFCKILSVVSFNHYHNAPSQGKRVTYPFFKSKRGPKFSDLLKTTQLGRPGKKNHRLLTPSLRSLLCILAQPYLHMPFNLPVYPLGRWGEDIPICRSALISISQFFISTSLFIESL